MAASFTDHLLHVAHSLFLHERLKVILPRNKLLNLVLTFPCLWGHRVCDPASPDPLCLESWEGGRLLHTSDYNVTLKVPRSHFYGQTEGEDFRGGCHKEGDLRAESVHWCSYCFQSILSLMSVISPAIPLHTGDTPEPSIHRAFCWQDSWEDAQLSLGEACPLPPGRQEGGGQEG